MFNKLKAFLSQLISDVKQADFSDPATMLVGAAFVAVPVVIGFLAFNAGKTLKTDIRAASVMIVNRAMNSGGTGVILSSTESRSTVLTNDHVCKLIRNNGGIVRAQSGDYQADSVIESESSDLCMVEVLADLGYNTKLSENAPSFYQPAIISGHPALFPNVVSTGHFSGRQIIEVMTGTRKCSDEELANPNTGLVCLFFGGIPVIKSYESLLVTATIMPGSSGSGVYNKNEELSGLVFAGSSEFGYAWTVPYEQVVNFLYNEHQHLKVQKINQEINILGDQGEDSKHTKEVLEKCNSATEEVILAYCKILKRDMVWRE